MQARYTVVVSFNEEEAKVLEGASRGEKVGRVVKKVVMGWARSKRIPSTYAEVEARKGEYFGDEIPKGRKVAKVEEAIMVGETSGERLVESELPERGEGRELTIGEIEMAAKADALIKIRQKRKLKWKNRYCPGHHVFECTTCD